MTIAWNTLKNKKLLFGLCLKPNPALGPERTDEMLYQIIDLRSGGKVVASDLTWAEAREIMAEDENNPDHEGWRVEKKA